MHSSAALLVRICRGLAECSTALEMPAQFLKRIGRERGGELVPARDLIPLLGAPEVRWHEYADPPIGQGPEQRTVPLEERAKVEGDPRPDQIQKDRRTPIRMAADRGSSGPRTPWPLEISAAASRLPGDSCSLGSTSPPVWAGASDSPTRRSRDRFSCSGGGTGARPGVRTGRQWRVVVSPTRRRGHGRPAPTRVRQTSHAVSGQAEAGMERHGDQKGHLTRGESEFHDGINSLGRPSCGRSPLGVALPDGTSVVGSIAWTWTV